MICNVLLAVAVIRIKLDQKPVRGFLPLMSFWLYG